jgi:RimJ/RimL family protein N-acetyltransferase
MMMTIRPIQKEDLKTRVEWINHPSVINNMYFDYPITIEDTTRWFNSLSRRENRVDMVAIDNEGLLVGMFGLTNINNKNLNAEFHIFINPITQGKGFGKALIKWTVNFGFLKKGLNKIYLLTDRENLQAFSLYRKIGFVEEGVLREQSVRDGTFVDRYFMGILKRDWENANWRVRKVEYEINVD